MNMRTVMQMLGALMSLALANIVAAADGDTLRAVVTSVSGNSVYLDKGRSDGVVEGLDVRLFPDGGTTVVGVVRAVSANSARVELPLGADIPAVGTPAEVTLPSPEPTPTPENEPENTAPPKPASPPEHPAWSQDLSNVAADAPLLAPVNRQDPRKRPMTFSGRAYLSTQWTHDMGSDRSNDYFTGRLGTSLNFNNPFGYGGRLRFDTDISLRHKSLGTGTSSSDANWRVKRFSYALGGEDFSPYRIEVGRFYSIYLPELGLIDGIEGALRFDSGFTLGAGFGMLPENDKERSWDGDMGTHVFFGYDSKEPGRASAIVGYQKSWHDGAEDRDQIVARVNWRPFDQLWLYGFVRADIYTEDDTIKGSGFEFTEFWAQVRYTPTAYLGGSASYSRVRWPEVKRDDYVSIPIEIIENGVIDRVSFSLWSNLTKELRLRGNFSLWEDQDSDGSNGDLGLEWSGLGVEGLSIEGAVFFTDGSFNSGSGFRLDAHKTFGDVRASLGYEYFNYDVVTGIVAGDAVTRHLVRGGVSWNAGRWYYNLTGDYYFGDVDDAITLAAYVSYRF